MAMDNPLWMEVLLGKSMTHGPFSIAMFDYRRVAPYGNHLWESSMAMDHES